MKTVIIGSVGGWGFYTVSIINPHYRGFNRCRTWAIQSLEG